MRRRIALTSDVETEANVVRAAYARNFDNRFETLVRSADTARIDHLGANMLTPV